MQSRPQPQKTRSQEHLPNRSQRHPRLEPRNHAPRSQDGGLALPDRRLWQAWWMATGGRQSARGEKTRAAYLLDRMPLLGQVCVVVEEGSLREDAEIGFQQGGEGQAMVGYRHQRATLYTSHSCLCTRTSVLNHLRHSPPTQVLQILQEDQHTGDDQKARQPATEPREAPEDPPAPIEQVDDRLANPIHAKERQDARQQPQRQYHRKEDAEESGYAQNEGKYKWEERE
ncbi:hypothetical protein PG984_016397 [Apiospora sp. TS-2023a]